MASVLKNHCVWDCEVVSSAFEIRRTYIGARHSLSKAGRGYAVTDAVKPGTLLPARSELWTTFEADTRTTFRGSVPATARLPLTRTTTSVRASSTNGLAADLSRRAHIAGWPIPSLSVLEPNDVGLNKEGSVVFAVV